MLKHEGAAVKTGIVLINLGSPDNTSPKAVRRYLRQFLNDKRVFDLPWYLRWPLVNFIIIPFRYRNTCHAYKQIWTSQGSPLLTHTRQLVAALNAQLGLDYKVVMGMRYGQPSIESALNEVQDCEKLVIIPLFPQYSSAATGSALEKVYAYLSAQKTMPALKVVQDFYEQPGFIESSANTIRSVIDTEKPDYILFSYHGLPVRHLEQPVCQQTCRDQQPCIRISSLNRNCYRAQCYATTSRIANLLGLKQEQYGVAFQSRLGKTPWIKPYTDEILLELKQKQVKNLAIVCPSFVSDCLETLEEIAIRANAQWMQLGGEKFSYIPCLNNTTRWVKSLVELIQSGQSKSA